MAITKAPTYGFTGAGALGGWNYPTAPAPKKAVAPASTPIGFTGSGWNYPSSSYGGSVVNYPTAPGKVPTIVAPATSFGSIPTQNLPGASAVPGPDTNPNLDIGSYMGDLTSDPTYQQGLASYNTQVQANRNALASQLKQSIIQGGWGSGQVKLGNVGGQDLSGDIDQATWDAASGNQMSDRAQLQTQLNRGLADVGTQLGARGAARSGAANIMAANNQNQYDVAANQAMQNLASNLSGNVGQWAQNNAYALSNWNNLQGGVANRLAQIATAQAQLAYSNAQNQGPQQVNLGGTQVTKAPTGPSPATTKVIQAVKQKVAVPKYGYTGSGPLGGWNYPGARG
jgi:hypothetical protein